MLLGPFLRREMITSVRSARVIRDRLIAVSLVTGVVAGCVLVWDQWGWDRTSVSAAAWFALVAFGLTAFTQAGIAIGLVVGQVAPAIASERDRKSLDALLTTQLSSAEIVVGTMAAGLLRAANGLAAAFPLVVLMVFFSGASIRGWCCSPARGSLRPRSPRRRSRPRLRSWASDPWPGRFFRGRARARVVCSSPRLLTLRMLPFRAARGGYSRPHSGCSTPARSGSG